MNGQCDGPNSESAVKESVKKRRGNVEGKDNADIAQGGELEDGNRKTSFIAIHLGAGDHSRKLKNRYSELTNKACAEAMKILKTGGSASDAVVEAIKVLENSGIVNAGSGSNLTIEGTVECDAAFMDGGGYFGGVGGVPGVPNPVLIAKNLAEYHKNKKLLKCGRVPPNFIVGVAAKSWAESNNIPTCDNDALISGMAKKSYHKYKAMLESPDDCVNDTVGAVALDKDGKVATAVSSGGNWLKYPGRIGHSPLFGCGCYCMNQSKVQGSAIAICTSGSGEMLSKVRLPQDCAQEVNGEFLAQTLAKAVKKHFLDNPSLNIHKEPRFIGLIGLSWDGFAGELVWNFTTKNFVIGYQSSQMRSAQMRFLELPADYKVGKNLSGGGIVF